MSSSAITDLDELRNAIVLGLDLWVVFNDSEVEHYAKPVLFNRDTGVVLTNNGRRAVRVQMLGIPDPSFKTDGLYAENGARVFNHQHQAKAHAHDLYLRRRAVRGLLT